MDSLFDSPSDRLPLDMQYLHELLYRTWGDGPQPRDVWHQRLRDVGRKPAAAFETLLAAGAFVADGDGFRIEKEV